MESHQKNLNVYHTVTMRRESSGNVWNLTQNAKVSENDAKSIKLTQSM